MFNKIKKEIEKNNKEAGISPRMKLFEDLKKEMSSQYAINPPTTEKQIKIQMLREQCDNERQGLEDEYLKQVEELNIRYMRSEIDILKEKLIIKAKV